MDTILDTRMDTKRLMADTEKLLQNCVEFCGHKPHIFPRKCSAVFIRNPFIWWSYRMEGQIGQNSPNPATGSIPNRMCGNG